MFGLPNEVNQSLHEETKTIKGLLQKKLQNELNKKRKIQLNKKKQQMSDNQLEVNGQNNIIQKQQDQSQVKQIIIFKSANRVSVNQNQQDKLDEDKEGILEEMHQLNQSLDTKKDDQTDNTLINQKYLIHPVSIDALIQEPYTIQSVYNPNIQTVQETNRGEVIKQPLYMKQAQKVNSYPCPTPAPKKVLKIEPIKTFNFDFPKNSKIIDRFQKTSNDFFSKYQMRQQRLKDAIQEEQKDKKDQSTQMLLSQNQEIQNDSDESKITISDKYLKKIIGQKTLKKYIYIPQKLIHFQPESSEEDDPKIKKQQHKKLNNDQISTQQTFRGLKNRNYLRLKEQRKHLKTNENIKKSKQINLDLKQYIEELHINKIKKTENIKNNRNLKSSLMIDSMQSMIEPASLSLDLIDNHQIDQSVTQNTGRQIINEIKQFEQLSKTQNLSNFQSNLDQFMIPESNLENNELSNQTRNSQNSLTTENKTQNDARKTQFLEEFSFAQDEKDKCNKDNNFPFNFPFNQIN